MNSIKHTKYIVQYKISCADFSIFKTFCVKTLWSCGGVIITILRKVGLQLFPLRTDKFILGLINYLLITLQHNTVHNPHHPSPRWRQPANKFTSIGSQKQVQITTKNQNYQYIWKFENLKAPRRRH